jgi:hypothetical protein
LPLMSRVMSQDAPENRQLPRHDLRHDARRGAGGGGDPVLTALASAVAGGGPGGRRWEPAQRHTVGMTKGPV